MAMLNGPVSDGSGSEVESPYVESRPKLKPTRVVEALPSLDTELLKVAPVAVTEDPAGTVSVGVVTIRLVGVTGSEASEGVLVPTAFLTYTWKV
jgi:hypothetical protein